MFVCMCVYVHVHVRVCVFNFPSLHSSLFPSNMCVSEVPLTLVFVALDLLATRPVRIFLYEHHLIKNRQALSDLSDGCQPAFLPLPTCVLTGLGTEVVGEGTGHPSSYFYLSSLGYLHSLDSPPTQNQKFWLFTLPPLTKHRSLLSDVSLYHISQHLLSSLCPMRSWRRLEPKWKLRSYPVHSLRSHERDTEHTPGQAACSGVVGRHGVGSMCS